MTRATRHPAPCLTLRVVCLTMRSLPNSHVIAHP